LKVHRLLCLGTSDFDIFKYFRRENSQPQKIQFVSITKKELEQ
jgi:hypothetical protein